MSLLIAACRLVLRSSRDLAAPKPEPRQGLWLWLRLWLWLWLWPWGRGSSPLCLVPVRRGRALSALSSTGRTLNVFFCEEKINYYLKISWIACVDTPRGQIPSKIPLPRMQEGIRVENGTHPLNHVGRGCRHLPRWHCEFERLLGVGLLGREEAGGLEGGGRGRPTPGLLRQRLGLRLLLRPHQPRGLHLHDHVGAQRGRGAARADAWACADSKTNALCHQEKEEKKRHRKCETSNFKGR